MVKFATALTSPYRNLVLALICMTATTITQADGRSDCRDNEKDRECLDSKSSTPTSATGKTLRFYSPEGRYEGNLRGDGRTYDKQGAYRGRVNDDGRRYDEKGRYLGRIAD